MILSWVKRRRRQALREVPPPAEWADILRNNVFAFARLTREEQVNLLGFMQVFIAEKNWEGCGGLEMTEEVKVTIAAQAGLLAIGLEDEYFERAPSILVYPSGYRAPARDYLEGGVVLEREDGRSGEAWYRGPVILSWDEVLAGGRDETDGENLVIHEFAHHLDLHNGPDADGVPVLATMEHVRRWKEVFAHEFEQHRLACRRRQPTLLDPYGAQNEAEFFAVATECFFLRPKELRERHPDLYEVLKDYYKQEPAGRE